MECKVEDLEKQITALTKEHQEERTILHDYNFAKDARIKFIKNAVENITRWQKKR